MEVRIYRERLVSELETLASFSATPAPAITRIVFSPPDLQARAWLKAKCVEAALDIREDAVGNTFARWHGSVPGLGAIGTGSHIDAIPNSGRFDGTVGVLGGLEAIRALQAAGYKPKRSLELLLFTSEEPTRFGIGCLGSRLLSGSLGVEAARLLSDSEGASLDAVRTAAHFEGCLDQVKLKPGYYDAFIELHIEQGPILEREAIAIGIVTNIAAPASLRIVIEGEGGHAGAVLMPQRRDALLGAAEITLAVESAALATGSTDTVATTGVCRVFPGAVNSIPSSVTLEIDVRDVDLDRRNGVLQAIQKASERCAVKRGLVIRSELLNADAPATCDPKITSALERASRKAGLTSRFLVSRAYHDSLFMARIAPTGMLFIPCRAGVSHRPDEDASPEAIANGCLVLAHTLADLAA